ncbi:acylneuraminate cytidylyltransferase family protein [Pelagibacteraceae bacterium]|jgi:CMP-N-acetylneuraminic acid synthetase|nr:acylneuraminate cytidylyltransferase family protein [Pelagibacteraceae bacterium]
MKKQKIVALLPMKAHSERIKGKNFKNFNGKPLFSWMLDTLIAIKEIDHVIINTDARETLLEKGLIETDRVIIRNRKQEICGDTISMNLIIQDDIENINADIYLMTHTTNPLISGNTIKEALESFLKNLNNKDRNIDSLFTVDKIQNRFYRKNCSAVNHDPNNLLRTQDLEPWFEENSNLYIFTKESFKRTKARIGKKPMMYETPKFESIDIDTKDDWDFATVAGTYLLNKKKEI